MKTIHLTIFTCGGVVQDVSSDYKDIKVTIIDKDELVNDGKSDW